MAGRVPKMRRTLAPVPIIVGCWRSGTTLLRAMFDAHPEIAVMYEWNVLTRWARLRTVHDDPDDHGLDTRRLVDELASDPHVAAAGVDRQALSAGLRPPVTDIADAARRLFGTYSRHFHKPRCGEKSTSYLLELARAAEILPEARFIHIIRDGRDAALAAVERGYGPPSVSGNAFAWRRRVSAGRAAGRTLGPDRYVEIRYEDLLEDPEHALRGLCDFVELDFHPAALHYHQNPDVGSTTGDAERHPNLRLPPTPGLRDWRRDMGQDDQAMFAAVAGDLLAELGYERGAPLPVQADRVAATWAGWRAWREHLDAAPAQTSQTYRGSERR